MRKIDPFMFAKYTGTCLLTECIFRWKMFGELKGEWFRNFVFFINSTIFLNVQFEQACDDWCKMSDRLSWNWYCRSICSCDKFCRIVEQSTFSQLLIILILSVVQDYLQNSFVPKTERHEIRAETAGGGTDADLKWCRKAYLLSVNKRMDSSKLYCYCHTLVKQN